MNNRQTLLQLLLSVFLALPLSAFASPVLIVGQASKPKNSEAALAVKTFLYADGEYTAHD